MYLYTYMVTYLTIANKLVQFFQTRPIFSLSTLVESFYEKLNYGSRINKKKGISIVRTLKKQRSSSISSLWTHVTFRDTIPLKLTVCKQNC